MPKDTLLDRFWARVRKTDTCWLWIGARSNTERFDAYGVFYAGDQKYQRAHRFAYELAYGSIPEGLLVCHHCDVRLCVRPDHLFLATIQGNMIDRDNKGRQPKGERHGAAKLTEAQVLEIRRVYAAGGILLRELAAKYGMSIQAIQFITSGRQWRYLLPRQKANVKLVSAGPSGHGDWIYRFSIDCE